MKAVGIIVEYNPCHNGHFYHIQQSKKQTEADCVIAVMSGHFLQRGEPSLVSKWIRAEMAMAAGVDIVIELPYVFSTQTADIFASGAISLLQAVKAHSFCFGSESGVIDPFLKAVHFSDKNKETLSLYVKQALDEGHSYPRAMSIAFKKVGSSDQVLDLSQPNNILGYAYIKALKAQNSDLHPYTIQRIHSSYHDETLSSSGITSATSIRKALFSGEMSIHEMNNFMPKSTQRLLQSYLETYGAYHNWESYFSYLKYKLFTMTPMQLSDIFEIEEGIEHRLLHYIKESNTFQQFMENIKNKRYTWTRLQRMCVHILTHTTKEQVKSAQETQTASYIRLLGMTENGQAYLKLYKKKFELPIVSTVSKFHHPQLNLDIKATGVYGLSLNEPLRSKFSLYDYQIPPILFKRKE